VSKVANINLVGEEEDGDVFIHEVIVAEQLLQLILNHKS
jgi:hypothetical protein